MCLWEGFIRSSPPHVQRSAAACALLRACHQLPKAPNTAPAREPWVQPVPPAALAGVQGAWAPPGSSERTGRAHVAQGNACSLAALCPLHEETRGVRQRKGWYSRHLTRPGSPEGWPSAASGQKQPREANISNPACSSAAGGSEALIYSWDNPAQTLPSWLQHSCLGTLQL